MKKIDSILKKFIIGTLIIIFGMTGVAILFYYVIPFFYNLIFIGIALSISFILEYYWMQKYDREKRIIKKSKMIEIGLIADDEDVKEIIEAEKQKLSEKVNGEKFVSMQLMDKFRSYMKLLITELSEIEVEIDNLYRECIDMIKENMTMKAKEHFRIISNANMIRIQEMDDELGKKFNLFFAEKLKSQKTLKFLKSFKEEWEKRKSKTVEIIKSVSKKFEQKSYFQHHIEEVFNFELEKKRKFTMDDNLSLKIPEDQLKKIIETIEKPSTLNLDEVSREKKQELGKIGKKVIAYFTNNNEHPNLPAMVMRLGIALSEAKDVLMYLKLIGMIDEVRYHVKK
ncbi:MAG: hypothetical protein EAX96_08815 [Candidatus Lokiarchaeota archaeon]|nr:hypothetical protein [Candidatus Lokiarchaeota archaeon]